MVNAVIYVEGGGGDSKELNTRCREGFRKLLERCGFKGRMPRLVACGGRSSAYKDFKRAHAKAGSGSFIAMLIDSEDPVEDINATWAHLKSRDKWDKPAEADDKQVLFMTTCMETWIITDRATLQLHYGSDLQETSMPPVVNMESRSRQSVQAALVNATRDCSNNYEKGKRSFEVLGKLEPDTLAEHLPSFVRTRQILQEKL